MACGPAACLALSLEFDWWIGRICWATKDRRLLYGEQQLQPAAGGGGIEAGGWGEEIEESDATRETSLV